MLGDKFLLEMEFKDAFGVGCFMIREVINGFVAFGAVEVCYGYGVFVLVNPMVLAELLDVVIWCSVMWDLLEVCVVMEVVIV